MTTSSSRGFTLIELLVAMGLTVGLLALVFSAIAPSESSFVTQLEAADMQQRFRVAADAVIREIDVSGAGPSSGMYQGPLTRAYAAVLPYRIGSTTTPPGSVTPDVITIVSVPPTFAQSTIAGPLTGASGSVNVQLDPGCPLGAAACGFSPDMMVAAFDGAGALDVFIVRSVAGLSVTLEHTGPPSLRVYPAGSGLVEIQVRVLSRRIDDAGVEQLVRESGVGSSPVPVVDHVVDLVFEYFGDPAPPQWRPGAGPHEPETTYGPEPPPSGTQTSAYPPGENCLFAYSGVRVARLPVLLPDAGPLVRLSAAHLSDGPWCPDASHPLRFDADLLRVRAVTVALRVQAATATLRGPAGPLFARAGVSIDGRRLLPDLQSIISIAPPNLRLVVGP